MLTHLLIVLCMLTDAGPKPAISSVELSLRTRGYMKSIVMDARHTKVNLNNVITTKRTLPRQWHKVLKMLSVVPLNELPSLQANTARSQVDAAYITHLLVTTPDQTYESAQFDHSDPPRQLANVVKALIESVPPRTQAAFR